MASPNIELVRSICEAWGRGDFSGFEWAHPEIEFIRADGPAPTRSEGHEGMARGTRTLIDAWDNFRAKPEEYRELDEERVLVLTRLSGRGRSSGVELDEMRSLGANLFHVRDGKVVKLVDYMDRDRALADLGLDG